MLWPPRTSCGPRSSVPPVTRNTDVQPSLIRSDSSVCVSSSRSTVSLTLNVAGRAPCANAIEATSGKAAANARIFFTQPPSFVVPWSPADRSVTAFALLRTASAKPLTRDTFVIVLRAELLEQLDRFRIRLHALHRTVRHIDGGLPVPFDERHVAVLHTRESALPVVPPAAA